jgi:hypothetical protein
MTLKEFRDMVNKYCEEHPDHLNIKVMGSEWEISRIDPYYERDTDKKPLSIDIV